ncbi:MAG TPA: transcription termination/antitermination protein NusG [Pirellulales bacterium]|nr:transcription termination/antitermination protein NusG [Pirellulales bacterium]
MSTEWENTGAAHDPAASGAGEAAHAPSSLPPDDAAPPNVVAASEPTGPGSHMPDATSGEDIAAAESAHPAPEPEEELDPEHEPKGIAVALEDDDRPVKMDWYILKVQSNREDSIRESLKRNVERAGLNKYFGEIIVPIETVTEFKGGKKKVVKRKLYPGYLVVQMEINDDTWYLVRDTAGIGDFTGSIGRPTPMAPQDIAKIISKAEEKADEAPRLNIRVKKGDRVKINEGTFENFEGEVDTINEASGRVSVIINIFGRPTPVELEHWQIEPL